MNNYMQGSNRFDGYGCLDDWYDTPDEEWPPDPNRQRKRKIPIPSTAREYDLTALEVSYFEKENKRWNKQEI